MSFSSGDFESVRKTIQIPKNNSLDFLSYLSAAKGDVIKGGFYNREQTTQTNADFPKGPFRTKNSTESKFAMARKKRYGNSKTLRIVLRSACFSGKKRQEIGTDTGKLRRQQNTDSSAVLFLVRKGPLGQAL